MTFDTKHIKEERLLIWAKPQISRGGRVGIDIFEGGREEIICYISISMKHTVNGRCSNSLTEVSRKPIS
jgi:hypothetical protein